MKLIYADGTCALSVHILLEELGINYDAIKVDLKDKSVLESYNPLGYVPALVLDNGEVMTEAIGLLQFLSENHGGAFVPNSMVDKARCIEWLVFLSTEFHMKLGPLFSPKEVKPDYLKLAKEKINTRLDKIEGELSGQPYLLGSDYSLADMYCLAILRIAEHVGVSYESYPMIKNYKARLEARSFIKKVINDEHYSAMATDRWQPFSMGTDVRVQTLGH